MGRPPGGSQAEPGSTIRLGRVLAKKSGGRFQVGQPYLEDVTVEAQVMDELKGPKLIVRPRPLFHIFFVIGLNVHLILTRCSEQSI